MFSVVSFNPVIKIPTGIVFCQPELPCAVALGHRGGLGLLQGLVRTEQTECLKAVAIRTNLQPDHGSVKS